MLIIVDQVGQKLIVHDGLHDAESSTSGDCVGRVQSWLTGNGFGADNWTKSFFVTPKSERLEHENDGCVFFLLRAYFYCTRTDVKTDKILEIIKDFRARDRITLFMIRQHIPWRDKLIYENKSFDSKKLYQELFRKNDGINYQRRLKGKLEVYDL